MIVKQYIKQFERLGFDLAPSVKEAHWLDNGASVVFSLKDGQVCVTPAFTEYGRSFVIRVAKLIC